MLAFLATAWWVWPVMGLAVAGLLAFDLGVVHRRARVVGFREALAWTALWVFLTFCSGIALAATQGSQAGMEFAACYLLELSLSLDNVFVIALIFSYFRLPAEYQHRVLFWGVFGALVMRGVLIVAGAALVHRLDSVLYALGALVLFTGGRMLASPARSEPANNRVLRLVRRWFPVSDQLDGQRFVTRIQGRAMLTPLALVLVMVETSDLVFAADSVPATFAVTTKPSIILAANLFAILGLRSLYVVLASAMGRFRHLSTGLALVLVFIGVKMLLDPHGRPPRGWQVEIPLPLSLSVVAAFLAGSMVWSACEGRNGRKGAG